MTFSDKTWHRLCWWSTLIYIVGLTGCLVATLVFGRILLQAHDLSWLWGPVCVLCCLLLGRLILDGIQVLRGL